MKGNKLFRAHSQRNIPSCEGPLVSSQQHLFINEEPTKIISWLSPGCPLNFVVARMYDSMPLFTKLENLKQNIEKGALGIRKRSENAELLIQMGLNWIAVIRSIESPPPRSQRWLSTCWCFSSWPLQQRPLASGSTLKRLRAPWSDCEWQHRPIFGRSQRNVRWWTPEKPKVNEMEKKRKDQPPTQAKN